MARDNSSILSYLADKQRFTNGTEDIATEVLGYILSKSAAARNALSDTLLIGGANVGQLSNVNTQVTGDKGARPDLVGRDEHGSERVVIEVKFWAGLTDNQPNTYLERLPTDGSPAVLLFIAPEARLETLWPEVLRRTEGQFTLGVRTETEGIKTAIVDGNERRLMLTSWRSLLGSMSSRASVDGDSATERDILQLNALCEREDSEAFLPLRSEEFGPVFPRRMRHLHQLVYDAVERAREAGIANTTGRNVTPQTYGYGRYLQIGSQENIRAEAWFGVNYDRWATEEETPLWLHFDKRYKSTVDIANKIGYDHASFTLPIGVEYQAVLDSVVDYLREIAEDVSGSINTS